MSSISQSVLMAITATVNKYASSNVHAVHRREGRRNGVSAAAAASGSNGRRTILLSSVIAAFPVNDSQTELLKRYLKKSEENKAKNDKERLDSYYRRNYKDYFDFVEGSLQRKKEQDLTESEKGILDWLKSNR